VSGNKRRDVPPRASLNLIGRRPRALTSRATGGRLSLAIVNPGRPMQFYRPAEMYYQELLALRRATGTAEAWAYRHVSE